MSKNFGFFFQKKRFLSWANPKAIRQKLQNFMETPALTTSALLA